MVCCSSLSLSLSLGEEVHTVVTIFVTNIVNFKLF